MRDWASNSRAVATVRLDAVNVDLSLTDGDGLEGLARLRRSGAAAGESARKALVEAVPDARRSTARRGFPNRR